VEPGRDDTINDAAGYQWRARKTILLAKRGKSATAAPCRSSDQRMLVSCIHPNPRGSAPAKPRPQNLQDAVAHERRYGTDSVLALTKRNVLTGTGGLNQRKLLTGH
jgi:hypothetical protein